jgi:drug/metabolite transporter (DMT)-like permease
MSRPGAVSGRTALPAPGAAAPVHAVDLALLGVTLIWGINGVAVKFALARFSPLSFNAIRFLIASTLIFVVLRIVEGPLKVPWHDLPQLLLVGFLGNTLYQIGFIKGMAISTAGNVAFVLATMPSTTAFLGQVLKIEALSGRAWCGVGATLGGALLIVFSGGGGVRLGGATARGDLLVLAGTIGWCMYTLMSRRLLSRYTPLRLTAWTMVLGTLMLSAFAAPELVRQDWAQPGPAEWAALAGSAAFGLVVCYIVWSWGLSRIGTTRTAIYGNLTPLWGGFFGWLLLGEQWGIMKLAGAALILAGVALVRAGQAAPRPAAMPAPERPITG